jgi:hypothetical protein
MRRIVRKKKENHEMATAELLERRVLQEPVSPTVDPLLCALARLHIIPFAPESVARYKHSKAVATAAQTPPDLRQHAPSEAPLPLLTTERCLPVQCVVRTPYEDYAYLATWRNPYGDSAWDNLLILKTFSWARVPLTAFQSAGGVLPEPAQDMVAEISQNVPGASFEVEALRDEGDRTYDPFLVVSNLETYEEYHIYMWDEDYRP